MDPSRDLLEAFYQRELLRTDRAVTAHLPRLRELAQQCRTIVEFGVKRGASTSAFLLSPASVISYDIVPTQQARQLQALAKTQWVYLIENTLTAWIPPCDLLFVDSLHTYGQCAAELQRHASQVRRFLVFHDTITFGSIGADGETGRWSWTPVHGQSVPKEHLGIRPAIDEFMADHPDWFIRKHYADSHGLLILERRW